MKRMLDDVYEQYLKQQVEKAGAKYVGIQECEGCVYDLVLFNAPSNSTLAVKSNVNDLGDAVGKRLDAHKQQQLGAKNG
jgi:hypothetical protein